MNPPDTRQDVSQVREPIGFWSLDLSTNTIALDEAMGAFFSIDAAQVSRGIQREALWAKIHPEDLESLRGRIQEAIDARGPFAHTFRIQTSPSSVLTVRILGRCFTGGGGTATHVAGILMEAGDDRQRPTQVQVIEHLMQASQLASEGRDPLLVRLIEAVLLEAGRSLARRLASGDRR